MTLLGFSLVLTAAFCHATWNFFVKRVNAGPELVWMFSTISAVVYFPAALFVWLRSDALDMTQWIFVLGSVALHMAYFLLLQLGYRKGDLSIVYPTARSTGPLLSTTFAVLVLGEVITLQIAVGGLIIVFGVLMLTGGIGRGRRGDGATSLIFGLTVGVLIGTYTVWDAYAVSVLIVPPLILDYASSLGRSAVMTPVAIRRWPQVKLIWVEHKMAVIWIALLNPLAYILVLYAMTFTPVVFVAPIRETSVLLSVLAGSLLLGEGNLKHRLSWAIVILAGVSILATSG